MPIFATAALSAGHGSILAGCFQFAGLPSIVTALFLLTSSGLFNIWRRTLCHDFARRPHDRETSNRDRGSLTTPPRPTAPDITARIRRFDGLGRSWWRDRSRPSELKKAVGNAMVSAGPLASRQGPCGLPAVCAARSRPTPWRRSSANRSGPRLHCFQAMARNRRLVHSSSARFLQTPPRSNTLALR
jgi:hypothetical protein